MRGQRDVWHPEAARAGSDVASRRAGAPFGKTCTFQGSPGARLEPAQNVRKAHVDDAHGYYPRPPAAALRGLAARGPGFPATTTISRVALG